MVNKTTNISFNVDKNLKKKADVLFESLGINTNIALEIFLNQSVIEQGFPFIPAMKVPNKRLLMAIQEVEDIENGKITAKRYNDFNEVLKDLDN